ncbi:MAG: dTMP kinase [Hormoscilla sp. SP12CHS1]|nr:dTMP kinase [Hormoscilla sp. SP12CHS1]
MQGKLIVFEGTEGSGKTTQIQLLYQWLRCRTDRVAVTREPGGTPLGEKLRQILLAFQKGTLSVSPGSALSTFPGRAVGTRGGTPNSHYPHRQDIDSDLGRMTELLLYAADRSQHVEEFIKPQLAKGTIVLCDRFTDSTLAYQGYGRGLNLSKIEQLNQMASFGLHSDLTLWLDLDVEVGLLRTRQQGSSDRMEQADLEFHRRVYRGFAQLAKEQDRIIRVDASGSQSLIQAHIQTIITEYLTKWQII